MADNRELFKKMMRVSRRLKMNLLNTGGHEGGMHGMGRGMGHGMRGMGPGMGPAMGPGMGAGMGPGMGHGMGPGMGAGMGPGMGHGMRPPFGPKGCKGMKGRGMSRERLLVIISDYPDGVRQKELAEHAGINASSTSEVVNRLEDDGYLKREVDPTDRRATILKLTELGEARAAEIREERESMFAELFGKLSDEEKDTLAALLDKMLED